MKKSRIAALFLAVILATACSMPVFARREPCGHCDKGFMRRYVTYTDWAVPVNWTAEDFPNCPRDPRHNDQMQVRHMRIAYLCAVCGVGEMTLENPETRVYCTH